MHPPEYRLSRRTHKLRAVATFLALTVTAHSVVFAQPRPLNPVSLKQALMARGIGKAVKVKELDGTTLTGIITSIQDDSFGLTPKTAFQPLTIPYNQVVAVHADGIPVAGKVGLGVVAIATTCVLIVVVTVVVAVAVHR